MSPSTYRVRRATIEDLDTLRPLWEAMRLPVAELERRLTEFQVAEGPDAQVVGAIGFLMTARNGRIHSEVFSDFGVADAVRPLFWERLQVLAANHGIFRIWTREEAPFWKQNGLQPANPDTLKKLPSAWGDPADGWLTLQLKNEEAIASVEKEMAMLMMTEKERTARAVEKAKRFKTIFTILAFVVGIIVCAIAIYGVIKYREKGL